MGAADVAISFALAQVGKPYVFGAEGPDAYDCSGLVWRSYKQAGVSIGRVTGEQILDGVAVDKSAILPGDLVFPEPTHVMLAIGGGKVVVAPHTGTFVRVESLPSFIWRVRRVTSPGSDATDTGGTPTPVQGVGFTNPLDAVSEFGTITSTLSSANFWKRVGAFVFGSFLVLVGVILMFHRQIGTAAKTGVKAAEIGAIL